MKAVIFTPKKNGPDKHIVVKIAGVYGLQNSIMGHGQDVFAVCPDMAAKCGHSGEGGSYFKALSNEDPLIRKAIDIMKNNVPKKAGA